MVTWHFVWRQSDLGKLTPATRGALLVSECLGDVDAEVADRVAAGFVEGLSWHFGAEPRWAILERGAEPWLG